MEDRAIVATTRFGATPLAAMTILKVLVGDPAHGQASGVIKTDYCDRCAVQVEHIVTITGHDSLGGITPTATMVPLPTGEYAAINWSNVGGIGVFDSNGAATRVIGRWGAGPGEFTDAYLLRMFEGHLYVFDRGNARLTVFSPRGDVLHELSIDVPITSLTPLPDGRFVAGAEMHSPDAVGLPLHFLSDDGALVRSFGDELGAYGPGLGGIRMRRILQGARNGSFWSARRGEYVLEHWSPTGERLRRLDRRVSWFPPADPMARLSLNPDSPPQTRIMDIRIDDRGLIWVLIGHRANDWRDHVVKNDKQPVPDIVMYRPQTNQSIWTTVLEIIDPDKGVVIFTKRYSPMFLGFLEGGDLYSYEEDEREVGRYHVWRFTFSTPNER